MPILGSFGAAAARGFGETAGAGNVDVEYLIVAGGGGGGKDLAGGGGAGGFRLSFWYNSSFHLEKQFQWLQAHHTQ